MQVAQESAGQSERISTLRAEQKSLRHEATTDRLTGLANRASFDDAIARVVDDRLLGRTRSGPSPLAMIDIDRFKVVNDVHGHICGDHVLAAVGRRLAETTRADEIIARYGGEEFVLIAPIVPDMQHLESLAERFRKGIAELRIEFQGAALVVTVSVGALAVVHLDPTDPVTTLVEGADELLYAAKAAGRNTSRTRFSATVEQ